MKKLFCILALLSLCGFADPGDALGECCTAPDNGSGTIDFPPDCPYDNPNDPMLLVDGLPQGSTIELYGPMEEFYNVANTSGGTLGGEICTFDARLTWSVVGTGGLDGFSRNIAMPITGEIHIGPRTPGDSIQVFDADLYDLTGELFGDPDFCMFRIAGGTSNGYSSPGHAVLEQLPNGDFDVDSFFDISYRLEFEGCPDSQLADMEGATTGTVRRATCTSYTVDWCRLQSPTIIEEFATTDVAVYGRLYLAGVTDQTSGNDPIPGIVRGQVGYGPRDSDPSNDPGVWFWSEAVPNPAWNDASEPGRDEYMATLTIPSPGEYDFAYRFSGDGGTIWVYADKDTGVPGEDGSENGYQTANAGKMTSLDPCCVASDNGGGTIDFPADCPYDNPSDPMLIIEGVPQGSTIELYGPMEEFYNVVNSPGGTLGGEICTFDARFRWSVVGTGELEGFSRHIVMPLTGEIHIGPRTPGDPIQAFDADLYELTGELFGDPDFCMMRIAGGTNNGFPSPGHANLTRLPNGDFAVDSFFDISYRIEFEGCPDSQLADMEGATTGTVRRATCTSYTVNWCRLHDPTVIDEFSGVGITVYGRLHVDGVTDQTSGNDPIPGIIRGQVGYGPRDSDPSIDPGTWTWSEAAPNPGWNDASEPGRDEYMATLTTPVPGEYDFAYRFSGNGGMVWVYADKDTGVPGEDGSENGYQIQNAGKMTTEQHPCCYAPGNGQGTADFPADCPYDYPDEPIVLTEGLPAGTTIELDGPMENFFNVTNTPGGTLGGEICTFQAQLTWAVSGTGDLEGFTRSIVMPVAGEIHIGPRTPGEPVQTFPMVMFDLFGELFGDPDFCMFRITAGSDNGLPNSGFTTLIELSADEYAVDSFFDIAFQVEFAGCPDSQLRDMEGTTVDQVRRSTCNPPSGVPDDPSNPGAMSKLYLAPNIPNPFGASTAITYTIPSHVGGTRVALSIYDVAGRLVRILVDAQHAAGEHQVFWDGTTRSGRTVRPGIYFYLLRMNGESLSRRMLLLR